MRAINLKLIAGATILAGTTAYLAYLGASTSWQYYVHVEECCADSDRLVGQRVRVNGKIAGQSLDIRSDRRWATFTLTGGEACLPVECRGPLPDNLKENIDVVVEGTLTRDGVLRGEKVLTKCASKYEAVEGTSSGTAVAGQRSAGKRL